MTTKTFSGPSANRERPITNSGTGTELMPFLILTRYAFHNLVNSVPVPKLVVPDETSPFLLDLGEKSSYIYQDHASD
jgi:hypothetical protein